VIHTLILGINLNLIGHLVAAYFLGRPVYPALGRKFRGCVSRRPQPNSIVAKIYPSWIRRTKIG